MYLGTRRISSYRRPILWGLRWCTDTAGQVIAGGGGGVQINNDELALKIKPGI